MRTVPLPVLIHLGAAAAALALGIVMLARRKGTLSHRRLGWAWVLLMTVVAVSSLWIPRFLAFGWIHLFTLLTAVSLPFAIARIRQGDVHAHAASMKGLFVGGLVVAGLFTLIPGRLLGNLVFRGTFGYF